MVQPLVVNEGFIRCGFLLFAFKVGESAKGSFNVQEDDLVLRTRKRLSFDEEFVGGFDARGNPGVNELPKLLIER